MATKDVSVVLAHGAWADGSSWARVITALKAETVKVFAAPLPLTSLADDVAALNRSLERTEGPVVLAGHAYAGAVIALARPERVKALVYVAALAPDEGEKVADVFYRLEPHPQAPKLAPDSNGLIWLPEEAFAAAFAQNASAEDRAVLAAVQRPYVFDYGAPTGFRIALRHPERIIAIISQNGNAYEEGLSEGWSPIRAYWQDPSQANRKALRAFLTPETTRWQYTHGAPDQTMVSPDGQNLDNFYLARPDADEVQLDLFGDYKSNVALYPSFQEYFRTYEPPLLAVWGKNDPFFLPPGAEAFKRDNPGAVVRFFDTGHFALETHAREIAESIRDFLAR